MRLDNRGRNGNTRREFRPTHIPKIDKRRGARRRCRAPAISRAMDTYDYVIVGGGTAGCVLANRLTASGKHRVLVLEAGPRDNYLWIHIPIGYGKTMFHAAYNWGFYTEPEPAMHDRKIYWPRGRGLGGSSSINGLIAVSYTHLT